MVDVVVAIVRVEEVEVGLDDQVALAPAGSPVRESCTEAENPPVGFTLTV